MALKINHVRPIGEPFLEREIIYTDLFYRSYIHNGRHFFSRLQMLLLHTVIFLLFKSLDAFNELNYVGVWIIFLTSRCVFFAFSVAKRCLSANILCGQSGTLQKNFRVSANKMTCLS